MPFVDLRIEFVKKVNWDEYALKIPTSKGFKWCSAYDWADNLVGHVPKNMKDDRRKKKQSADDFLANKDKKTGLPKFIGGPVVIGRDD